MAAALQAPPVGAHAATPEGDLAVTIEHLAHLLPSQGPISVFVHHNTLHAFESLSFAEGVCVGADLYGCHPYLPEAAYRAEFERGRITAEDLERELHGSFDQEGEALIGRLGTRHNLWLSMLAHPLWVGSPAEVRWFIEETEALVRFGPTTSDGDRRHAIDTTRRWMLREVRVAGRPRRPQDDEVDAICGALGRGDPGTWSEPSWEAFTLQLLWSACRHGAAQATPSVTEAVNEPTCDEADSLVDEQLIRFSGAFLDQGYAGWDLPQRDLGYYGAFCALHRGARPVEAWLRDLPRLVREETAAVDSIRRSLEALGATAPEAQEGLLRDELLKLRGWAGMLWQMETNAEWTARPAPRGTLVEYVAVRLLLLRLARGEHPVETPSRAPAGERTGLAFQAFQIAQVRGWSPVLLTQLTPREWTLLFAEITSFSSRQRRRVYHQAYERHYREQALTALRRSCQRVDWRRAQATPAYQVLCCIDDREESFRRALEEVDPECETLGAAGFFGVAMYYRGLGEAHFRPLCPVNVKPPHDVVEEPEYSVTGKSRRRAEARRALGKTAHRLTIGSRSVVGGLATGVLGAVAAVPLVLRVLFPRWAAQLRRGVGRIVSVRQTDIRLEGGPFEGAPVGGGQLRGYSTHQMADIVSGMLTSTGLGGRLAELVVVFGHGSSSLNNPHAAAYDCGACGGGKGGPNARALARMANDARVRAELSARGVRIPDATWFVGAYHNTCDDSVAYYDLDDVPTARRPTLERMAAAVEQARRLNAQERCRRFESASLRLTPDGALRHVEGRSEDLSQVRSECGHATNALCLVGRRAWSRGLFLDRRAFLTSYDPRLDDGEHSVLARILGAVIPVCGGINLEYYFSRIDNKGYGCGTKLPHNVIALLGVMDGAASDLRTGLPWQMVEIHEPVRLLFVIETTPAAIEKILAASPAIDQLVRGAWVQVATIEPITGQVHLFRDGRFEPFDGPPTQLPIVPDSASWRRGQRDHLGFALIDPEAATAVLQGDRP